MSINSLDIAVRNIVNEKLVQLETYFDADVIFFYGPIYNCDKRYKEFIERLKVDDSGKQRLVIILNTPGGIVETVEKLVNINRFHYNEIFFIVPDYAMSAGTVLCMSGDRIYMDYSSSLGPIDPQVHNGKEFVPALGYLDKVNEFIEKSKRNELSQAEFVMLQQLDLASLRKYEQAKELTVQLIEDWLFRYKFKNWIIHRTNPNNINQPVTVDEKRQRAQDIARKLGDNNLWHSHGRCININKLQQELRLEINDYSNDVPLRNMIRNYNDIIIAHIGRVGIQFFLHSRNFF